MDNGSAQRARMTLAGAMCCDSRTCSLVRLSVALVLKCNPCFVCVIFIVFTCSLSLAERVSYSCLWLCGWLWLLCFVNIFECFSVTVPGIGCDRANEFWSSSCLWYILFSCYTYKYAQFTLSSQQKAIAAAAAKLWSGKYIQPSPNDLIQNSRINTACVHKLLN